MIRKWETALCTPLCLHPRLSMLFLYVSLHATQMLFSAAHSECILNGIRLSQTYDSELFSSLKTILWIKSLVMVTTHGKTHDFPTSSPRGFSYFVFNAPLEQTWTLSIKASSSRSLEIDFLANFQLSELLPYSSQNWLQQRAICTPFWPCTLQATEDLFCSSLRNCEGP